VSRSSDSNLVRAGRARGFVDPSVEKRCSGPGSAIALWRNKHVRARFGFVASHNSRMMRTAGSLIIHALDTQTSRLSPEGISWNYDGPLLLLRNIEETQLPHRIPIHVHTAYDYRYHRGLNSRHTLRQAHTPAIQQLFHYPTHLTFSVESHAQTTG